MSIQLLSNYLVYDPSVWTEAGYTLQRFIGNSAYTGIKIFVLVFGVCLIPEVIHWITGIRK